MALSAMTIFTAPLVSSLGCVSMYANYLSDGLCPYDFCPCHKIGSNWNTLGVFFSDY